MRAEDVDIVEDQIAINNISTKENNGNDANTKHIQIAYELIKELVATHNIALLSRFIRCMKYSEKDGSTTDRWVKELDEFLANAWVPKCVALKLNLVGVDLIIAMQLVGNELLKYHTEDILVTIHNYSDEQLNNACYISYPPPVKSSSGCFIATAAFGSPFEENVMILKKFRDDTLSNYPAGQWFTRFYYKHSPPVAHFIDSREFAKSIVREMLRPIIFMVRYFGK